MDFDEDHGAEKGDVPSGGNGPSAYDSHAPLPNSSRIGPLKMDSSAAVASGYRSRQQGGGGTAGGEYKECLKNHAVGIGGHAVDGCGEFMAAGEEGTLDALKCAACNCHRNFHRKEVLEGGVGALSLMGVPDAAAAAGVGGFHHVHHHQPQPFSSSSPYYRTPTGYFHHQYPHHVRSAPPPLALPSTSGGGGSRDDQDDGGSPGAVMAGVGGIFGSGSATGGSSKKRFRTKFTQEQKDRMLEFAERLGWRMQKHDEAAVLQFCEETGVKRQVLKVWMHNNKHTHGKGSPVGFLHQPAVVLVGQQQQEGEHAQVVDMGERVVPPGA